MDGRFLSNAFSRSLIISFYCCSEYDMGPIVAIYDFTLNSVYIRYRFFGHDLFSSSNCFYNARMFHHNDVVCISRRDVQIMTNHHNHHIALNGNLM